MCCEKCQWQHPDTCAECRKLGGKNEDQKRTKG